MTTWHCTPLALVFLPACLIVKFKWLCRHMRLSERFSTNTTLAQYNCTNYHHPSSKLRLQFCNWRILHKLQIHFHHSAWKLNFGHFWRNRSTWIIEGYSGSLRRGQCFLSLHHAVLGSHSPQCLLSPHQLLLSPHQCLWLTDTCDWPRCDRETLQM